jgi:hypothetical protein
MSFRLRPTIKSECRGAAFSVVANNLKGGQSRPFKPVGCNKRSALHQPGLDRAHLSLPLTGRRNLIVTSARRAGPRIACRNGCLGLDRENRVNLREIRRVSRREISQAFRDALAWARFNFWERFNFLVHPAGSRKYGGGSCNPSVMRSYFAPACRASADMVRQPGAVRRTRGARAPHFGQADGSSHSAIARSRVNGPHFLHMYSYVGIDHLPPAKTHPAADQSVAIVGNYTS